jgi:exodeoxyribonuclease V gamma subunit
MLHVHRAERADALIDALRALLSDPLPDPFAAEVVAVPTRGMERWLAQRMSSRLGASTGRSDGICANVGFPSPRRLVGDAVASASGIDADGDPWLPERLVWPLLELVDESLGEPWLRALAVHLGAGEGAGDPTRGGRRFSTVRQLADLFDRYALHRPEMLLAWAGGADTDGRDLPLPPDGAWQAELWRRLRERIPAPDLAERVGAACARLREEPGLAALPERISLFGLTRYPASQLDVLRALAAARDVHLFLLHPSPALWTAVARATAAGPPVVRRRADPTAALAVNRLLASWGQDARELQLVISAVGDHADHQHTVEQRADSLLRLVQADVRADRAPPGEPLPGEPDRRPVLDPGDRSLQVHACHGRARQVEVVRDAILHLLTDDPALEPRDVIVMCPDIETFAPLIGATFGAGDVLDQDGELDALPAGAGPTDLRVRLADRALRQTNPVLGVVAQVIDLADERLTASQVLDLADREPVRRRFRFDDDDLARMQEWVAATGIRWGLDAAHRAPFKLDSLSAGTWRAGLDRVLVGVAMTEEDPQLFAGVLPLDDVESGAIDLAGRFAELIDRLQRSLDALGAAQTVDSWVAAIASAADALTATGRRDRWQRAELQRLLDDVLSEGAASSTKLAPAELRALLADRLKGRPTRANFRTGHLTICTLVPMRSVPHRVVCLLGLDDGVFPRRSPRDGDDLLLDDPRPGDRDSRTEDRQMLLDALLAATDRLIVTYTGKDERTNMPRPPAVPVGELLDVVDRTVRGPDSGAARTRVVVHHPLQPFDPRNFTPGELIEQRPWGFERVTLAGAVALAGERTPPGAFLDGPLPAAPAGIVELQDLVRFVERPVRAFLQQRLGIRVADYSDEIDDSLSVELDALAVWGVGQRMLDSCLAGTGIDAAVAAELARGTLPPGRLAQPVIARVRPLVETIAEHARGLLAPGADPGSVDVKLLLPDGRALSGTVAGVCGELLRSVTFSRVNPRHRLAMWVRWLALSAAYPERPYRAVTVGRARQGAARDARVTIAELAPLATDAATRGRLALAHLTALLELYDRGMREPLPLTGLASAAYAHAAAQGRDAEAAGRKAWESSWDYDREDKELEHQLVLGGVRTFAELLEQSPRPDEHRDGWDPAERSRFGRYARRMWSGPLSCERLADR